ncbi:hypothetical protein [Naasia sp. SYSU D00948]|uniref:hypothetical protein n=1 Tax=Naasia sp. SYSU D00948 TaxID=2817379 RepID=UPI001B3024FF|nr:hypothetical protein [Naasia sp. SYSU D00948]
MYTRSGGAKEPAVLFDETGQQTTRPIVVGAVITADVDRLETTVRELFDYWAAEERFDGMESYKHFLARGFHNNQIPLELQNAFIQTLREIDGLRIFAAVSDRTRLTLTDDDRCLVLYGSLLPDVIAYLRLGEPTFYFEENPTLQKHFGRLTQDAYDRAARRAPGRSLPKPEVRVTRKDELLALGVVDFVISIIANWVALEDRQDVSKREVRNYRAIERDIAVIYHFDTRERISRRHRAFPSSAVRSS